MRREGGHQGEPFKLRLVSRCQRTNAHPGKCAGRSRSSGWTATAPHELPKQLRTDTTQKASVSPEQLAGFSFGRRASALGETAPSRRERERHKRRSAQSDARISVPSESLRVASVDASSVDERPSRAALLFVVGEGCWERGRNRRISRSSWAGYCGSLPAPGRHSLAQKESASDARASYPHVVACASAR